MCPSDFRLRSSTKWRDATWLQKSGMESVSFISSVARKQTLDDHVLTLQSMSSSKYALKLWASQKCKSGERERETSVLEDLHETGGSLFMFLMSFRFFTWNLALRLDTIKRWEKNLSVVSEADSRELLLESQVAAVLEHLAPGFWRLDGTSAEPGWDVFLRSASLLP